MIIVFPVTVFMSRLLRSPYGARRAAGLGQCLFLLALCCIFLIHLPTADAKESWKAVITDHPAIPPYFIVVDKSCQELAFFERRSPLQLSRRFACTTGQATGDKVSEGDLKTPEGIYFVGYRIGSGLDFVKYGPEAYTLNYPNPVDRLRKKTGYGIWIHGRGEPLVPLQTEGCVSLNNNDLALLSKLLVPGTPVALTGSFVYRPEIGPDDEPTFAILRDKVEAWAIAWSNRSHEYFAFYDQAAYSMAQGEPFYAFQAQKERLFKNLPWIRTTVRDVQVLRGPGYWVTWFYQDYQAPNLQTHGVRRLYWGKNSEGELKILGMEWQPGLAASTMLASASPLLLPLDQQDPVWPGGLPELQNGEKVFSGASLDQTARSEQTTGNDSLLTAEANPARTNRPDARPSQANDNGDDGSNAAPAVLQNSNSSFPDPGAKISPRQGQGPDTPRQDAAPKQYAQSVTDHVEASAPGLMPRPSPEAVRIGREHNKHKQQPDLLEILQRASQISAQKTTPAPGDQALGLNLPTALPTQGIGVTAETQPAGGATQPSSPGKALPDVKKESIPATPSRITALAPPTPAQTAQASGPDPDGSAARSSDILSDSRPDAAVDIMPDSGQNAASDPVAAPLDHDGAEWLLERSPARAKTPPQTSGVIAALVEEWRVAWLAGDIDSYMAFYAPGAKQGSRGSASLIRKQKKQLWAKAPPSAIELADINIKLTHSTATVIMRQTYRDSQGGGDYGQKKLILKNTDGVWRITQEDWSALADEAGH